MPLYGVGSKINLALFPRKVNGKYAMLSRIDVNNYLMYSDSVTQWDIPFSYRSLVIHGNLLKLETADLQFGLKDG
jgi:predicted GH43/DUF377 family glycosyl hydrolase